MNCLFNWQANECFSITNRPLLHPHLSISKKNKFLFNTTIILNIFITFAMQKRKSRQAPNHIPVKSGEEWVKSEQKLFTTLNALFIGIYKEKVKSEEFLALRCNKK